MQAVELLREIGPSWICKHIGAVDQRVGGDLRPFLQIRGDFHHHGRIGGPGDGELKAIA